MELTARITDFPDTLQQATECIRTNMRTTAQAFVGIGYYLKYIRDKKMYQEAGYIDIWEYGKGELGLSKTVISRYISINDRFSMNGNSPVLLEEYKGYGYSKLSEMLSLTDEEIETAGITEATTITRIREVKKELKEEPEVQEQVPGQMNITEMLAPEQEGSSVETSQHDSELEVLSAFAIEYYEKFMDLKQHELFEEKEETAFIDYTNEIILLLLGKKKSVLHYVISSGRLEISPDGNIKLHDGVIRNWREVYLRLEVLKVLGELPDTYKENTFLSPEGLTPTQILIREIARETIKDIKTDNIEIPDEIEKIVEILREYYEASTLLFEAGINTYLADISGTEEIMTVNRVNAKTSQPERDITFEVCLLEVAREINYINSQDIAQSDNNTVATSQQSDKCDGNCFYCKNEDCNSYQQERKNCIYNKDKSCNIYKAHEAAVETGIYCISSCCNRCEEKECKYRCSYSKKNKNVINATEDSNLKEKKSDWRHGVFENDHEGYGYTRDQFVTSMFKKLKEQNLEITDIDGELVSALGRKRYAFISEDGEYVEFLEGTKDDTGNKMDFKVSKERLKKEYDEYKTTIRDCTVEEEEEITEEVITEPSRVASPEAMEGVIKDVQYNGCAGIDLDGEYYTCPPRRTPCDDNCKWKPTGLTFNESKGICNECWHAYVKQMIEKDRNGEVDEASADTTVVVNNNTLSLQEELPHLKNNEQRKEWIENYEKWPLWIDNKETQERYYRYIFKNGDIFVIRKAYSTRAYWDYKERKSVVKPHWGHQKEYIVKKDANLTLADSETSVTNMVEYLKDLQRK